jgi:hypothetical protein
VNDRGATAASPAGSDVLDRLFARIFVVIAALSWTGLILAEVGWFRPVPPLVLGVAASAIALLLVARALRTAGTSCSGFKPGRRPGDVCHDDGGHVDGDKRR